MVITALLDLVYVLINFIFDLLPDLPTWDLSILESLNTYVNLIFDNLNLLGFFFDIELMKKLTPWVVAVIAFKETYFIFMWILRKIPWFNIS